MKPRWPLMSPPLDDDGYEFENCRRTTIRAHADAGPSRSVRTAFNAKDRPKTLHRQTCRYHDDLRGQLHLADASEWRLRTPERARRTIPGNRG